MKNLSFAWMLVIAFALALTLVLSACSNEDSGPSAGVAVVTGFVKDASTHVPLADVTVEGVAGTTVAASTTTDAQGLFELRFDVDSTVAAKITIRNVNGYRDTLDITVVATPNQSLVKNIDLKPRSVVVGSGGGSGLAQTIAFLGATPTQVSVYGVGGSETAVLGFEVRDSLGLPIDAAHAVQIQLTLQGGPNGGEYISPSTLTTNAAGQAFIAFNSGTRSGVVQVVAVATVGIHTITSSPVRVVINAGFADQAHFTVAPEKHNFPALHWVNLRDKISVLVGDKYSNPVVLNTALYFRTGAGVIQPTVFTSVDGQGTADLISGNPFPADGYHWVVARTIGQGGAAVEDSVRILWSGNAQISDITPSSFAIPNGGYQDFTFTVSDEWRHPLAAGTTITVTASVPPPPDPNTPVNQVQLGFGRTGSIVLLDAITPGPGTTDFSFRLSDGTSNITLTTPVTVSITVTGDNGSVYATRNGTTQ